MNAKERTLNGGETAAEAGKPDLAQGAQVAPAASQKGVMPENLVNLIPPGLGSSAAEEISAATPPLGVELSEGRIILLSAVGHFLCHLAETIYPAVMLAVIDEFHGLDKLTAGFLVTLGYILLGVGALPVGLWTDAWGPLRVCRWYFVLLAAACLLVAATPNIWLLFVTLTLLGLAASIYHPVGLAMIALGVRSRGRAMGLNGIAGNLGIALGPTLGVFLYGLGREIGQPSLWRLAYVVVAVLSLAALGFFEWLIRGASFQLATRSGRLKAHPTNRSHQSPPMDDTRNARIGFLPLILLYAAMVFGGLNYRVLITALPLYISGSPGETESAAAMDAAAEPDQAAVAVFIALLVGGIGQYVGGWLADRYGARRVYPLMIVLVVPLGIMVGTMEGASWLVFVASLLAVCMFAQQPVENSVMAEQIGGSRQGLSYASKFTLTFGIGALGTPLATLLWQQFGSFAPAFFFIAGSAALMALLATAALGLGQRWERAPR